LKSLSWHRVSSDKKSRPQSYSLPCLTKMNGSSRQNNFETTNFFNNDLNKHVGNTRITNNSLRNELGKRVI